MKEVADIVTLARTGRVPQAALATVVRIEGSSYRRPGASLLIGADGRRLGSVSGGCLERDVESNAKAVIANGLPRLITYDTRPEADLVFGTAVGCGGLVEVFIERVDLLDAAGPVGRWAEAADRRATIAELIVIAAPEKAPVSLGQRAWITLEAFGEPGIAAPATAAAVAAPAATAGTAGGDAMAPAIAAAQEIARARRSGHVSYETASGDVRVFVRIVEPPVRLVIFGAGDDAQPLAQMASGLGWRVWVLDHRAGFAKPERFPTAERVEAVVAGELPPDFTPDPRTLAVVMNHHYPSDRAWLTALAPLPLPYVGLLGARHRTARLLEECELPPPGPGGLAQLYAPAGLDIGAEGAELVAIAMVAEMHAVLAGRRGGRLRDTSGPIIHSTPAPAPEDAALQSS